MRSNATNNQQRPRRRCSVPNINDHDGNSLTTVPQPNNASRSLLQPANRSGASKRMFPRWNPILVRTKPAGEREALLVDPGARGNLVGNLGFERVAALSKEAALDRLIKRARLPKPSTSRCGRTHADGCVNCGIVHLIAIGRRREHLPSARGRRCRRAPIRNTGALRLEVATTPASGVGLGRSQRHCVRTRRCEVSRRQARGRRRLSQRRYRARSFRAPTMPR
jgi:hypothetical protein